MSGPDTESRWAMDRAVLERALNSEREFREQVLVELAKISTRLEGMESKMDDHVEDDKERFAKVTQNIGDAGSKLQYMLGGAAMLALVATLAVALAKVLLP